MSDLIPPHCDAAILHAPSDGCKYCNELPEWQALRELWGICFTGHKPVIVNKGPAAYEQIACPSDIRRVGGAANRWPGNQAARDDK